MPEANESGGLERTLGLTEAFTVGAGTMVGAGIFIFPGLAAGRAGLAATLSFALGAAIAVLVALCVSELATAIPKSGGTYYFVAEGLGKPIGAVVGIGLLIGLVFASAFYLTGFGLYLDEIAREFGLAAELHAPGVGATTGLILTVINVVGTARAGDIQDVIVIALLGSLGLFTAYALLDAAGFYGTAALPSTFAPFGYLPILTTSALIFTSYLGFAGIANLAGEIENPSRNLPLSMLGSVLTVGLLYVLTIILAVSALEPSRLEALGETAMIEVGRSYLGSFGALVILLGGLLATLSSANASIMGASRSIFALSSEAVLPESASTVNESFGTPHYAVISTGFSVVAIVLVGGVEVLAEIASFMHLVLYGMLCVSVGYLRHIEPEWYQPTFHVPGGPVIPVIGAVVSFALIFFMKPASQFWGVVLMGVGSGWFVGYRYLHTDRSSPERDDD